MVDQIYPTELQFNKTNSSDTEAPFLNLKLSITNGIISFKIYVKWGKFYSKIVNFTFLDGDVPHSPSYGICISLLIDIIKFEKLFLNPTTDCQLRLLSNLRKWLCCC